MPTSEGGGDAWFTVLQRTDQVGRKKGRAGKSEDGRRERSERAGQAKVEQKGRAGKGWSEREDRKG
jgi:hypothetical protein